MKTITADLKNEDGFVLVTAMVMLVILTLLGTFALNATKFELQIAGNDRMHKKIFYLAESAANEGAQNLETEDDADNLRPKLSTKSWLHEENKIANLEDPDSADLSLFDDSGLTDPSAQVKMAAVGLGIVRGDKASSLTLTSSSAVYAFQLYGYSQERNGQVIIELGYKKNIAL